MEQPVRLGVQLALTRGLDFGRVVDLAARIADQGWATLWLSGWPDPCALAGALSASPAPQVLGIVAELPAGRHPAVLAREVTGLDVLSGGRAAVLAQWRLDPATTDPPAPDPSRYLHEATEVYRRVCSEELPFFQGSYLRVAGARNQPQPVRPGGPPIVVEAPEPWDAVAARVDGVIVGEHSLPATRAQLDLATISAGDKRPTLIWRAPANAGPDDIARTRDQGADGIVVTVHAGDVAAGLARLAAAWLA